MGWKSLICLLTIFLVTPVHAETRSVPLDLSSHFNGKAASTGVNDRLADFDGSGRAYPVQFLPKGGSSITYEGIDFVMPPFDNPSALDFVRSDSQAVAVPSGNGPSYQSLHGLAAAIWTPAGFAQGHSPCLIDIFAYVEMRFL
jgi:alpha-L-fucosidase